MIKFYSSKHHKAKKEHTCSMCGKIIQPGEVYERSSGKYDGYFFDEKYCEDCEVIIDEYISISCDCEIYDDDILDWLRENFCYGCIHGWHTDEGLDDCESSAFHCPIILEKIRER